MATFRQSQIDEILNYDRSMNRIILDREIQQATSFNDQRNPPSNRDIKFEALIGGLIDQLKQTIQETIQQIAFDQPEDLTSRLSGRLMDQDTGDKGFAGRVKPANNFQTAQAEQQAQQLASNAAAVEQAYANQTNNEASNAQQQMTLAADAEAVGEEESAIAKEPSNPPPAKDLGKEAKAKGVKGNGYPDRRIGMGYGYCGGAEDDEPAEDTTKDAEQTKSQQQSVAGTEKLIFKIISQYNGIVDKILQATQPDGRFSNRRMASANTISFLANVLKSVIDPLNQLIYNLSSVKNPELGSFMNMLTNLVAIIDSSPPFQKLNTLAYKNGPLNFQGYNNSNTLDLPGNLAALGRYRNKLIHTKKQLLNREVAILLNVANSPDQYRMKTIIASQINAEKERLDDMIGQVDRHAKQLQYGNEGEMKTAPALTQRIRKAIDKAQTVILPNIGKTSLNDELEALIHERDAYQEMADDTEDAVERAQYTQRYQELQQEINRLTDGVRLIPKNPAVPVLSEADLAELTTNLAKLPKGKGPSINIDTSSAKAEAAPDNLAKAMAKLPKPRGSKGSKGLGKGPMGPAVIRPGRPGYVDRPVPKAKGRGRPLADLLAYPEQQHTRMGRPVSNDDDIQRQMIINNQRWQLENNPVHTTPVGNLYPFYEKDPASKYIFPVRLRNELSRSRPQRNALGADVSLLQGPIGGPVEESIKPPKRARTRTRRTQQEATQNILEGKGYKPRRKKKVISGYEATAKMMASGKKNPMALEKILFNDEANEMFD